MPQNDVLTKTFGRFAVFTLGGGAIVSLASGTIVPLLVTGVAVVFVLVGYNAMIKQR